MFDLAYTNKLMTAGQRPCPRCKRMMPEYLELCPTCMWDEAEAARRQERLDALIQSLGGRSEIARQQKYRADEGREENELWEHWQDLYYEIPDPEPVWFDSLYNDAREADRYDLADTQTSVMESMRGW